MIGTTLTLGLLLLGADRGRGDAPAAADRITLRDGSVVLGVVSATTPGPRGSVEFLVRRDWAEKAVKSHAQQWDRSSAARQRQAVVERRKRLEAWRRDRAGASRLAIASCSGSIESSRALPAACRRDRS